MRSRLGTWTSTAASAGRSIAEALSRNPSCPKLGGYWRFYDCRYHKGSRTCSEPGHIDACPLPRHPLRNGHLNQMAYSLFLFMRDVADDDFVGWIDRQLGAVDPHSPDRLACPVARPSLGRCATSMGWLTRSWRWRCRPCC